MKARTVKIIVVLIGLLFLNIEAAHAGLLFKLKAVMSMDTVYIILSAALIVAIGLGFVFFAFFDNSLNLEETDTKN